MARRRRGQAHLVRRRTLFDAGVVAEGDLIAFTRQKGGEFGIGVMKPDGSGERIIAEGFHNEGPTFSPNGLFLMFFRDPGGEARRAYLHGRHFRPRRIPGADAGLCQRPIVGAAAELRQGAARRGLPSSLLQAQSGARGERRCRCPWALSSWRRIGIARPSMRAPDRRGFLARGAQYRLQGYRPAARRVEGTREERSGPAARASFSNSFRWIRSRR